MTGYEAPAVRPFDLAEFRRTCPEAAALSDKHLVDLVKVARVLVQEALKQNKAAK